MARRTLRMVLLGLSTLFVVPLFVFLLMELAPGDAASYVAGDNPSPERVQEVRERLNLDDPVFTRYARWAGSAVTGDLGRSLTTDEPVLDRITRAVPVTASLALGAITLTVILGTVGGMVSARRPGGLVDKAVTVVASIAIAIPSFWFGLLLALVLAVNLRWLPGVGYVSLSAGVVEWARHMLLPSLALAALPAAEFSRQLRAGLIDELGRDYVLAARARGVGATTVLVKHALKNAAVPVVTVLGFRLTQMIGGSAVVESVFALRGLGALTVSAAVTRDIPVLLAVVLVITMAVVVVNLLVDLSYGYFHPAGRK